MKFFLRLTPQGVGMHAGILPGYPASHGCIRLPTDMARIIYSKVGSRVLQPRQAVVGAAIGESAETRKAAFLTVSALQLILQYVRQTKAS